MEYSRPLRIQHIEVLLSQHLRFHCRSNTGLAIGTLISKTSEVYATSVRRLGEKTCSYLRVNHYFYLWIIHIETLCEVATRLLNIKDILY